MVGQNAKEDVCLHAMFALMEDRPQLDLVETAIWVPKLIRREYQMALSQVGNGVDDPDKNYPENHACGSRTYMDYCNREIDALIAAQSAERDLAS